MVCYSLFLKFLFFKTVLRSVLTWKKRKEISTGELAPVYRTRFTPPCQLDDAALVPSCCAPSRCGWSPYARKDKTPSASKLASGVPSFLAHGSSGFHMIIQTIPPLLSLTIFCMVSWSFTWHSSPIMEILLVMPSLTSCSTVFPKMLVSQMPSSSFRASEI